MLRATHHSLVRDWLASLLHVIYPARCRCCEDPLGLSSVPYLCDECWEDIHWIVPPYCGQCGTPLPEHLPHEILCGNCRNQPQASMRRSLVLYRGAIREAIHLFKYDGKRIFAKYFSEMIERRSACLYELGSHDGILPVPLHKKRYRERGFNQSEILAKSVASILNTPILEDLLIRTRNTVPQSSLDSPVERRDNLRGAFRVESPESTRGLRLLLVDDIYTTGATVKEATRTLLRAGAAEVDVFTLSKV